MRCAPARRTRWLVTVLVGLVVFLAACSGDDSSPSVDEPADGGPEVGEDGVVVGDGDPASPSLVLSDVEASGDALFPCMGEAGSGDVRVVYVQQLPVEVVGPLAEAFRAAVGDYQRRCGGVAAGSVDVAVGYRDDAAQVDVCALPQLAGAAVVVTDASDDATAACLASSSRLVWHEGGASDPATTAGTHAPLANRASRSVAAAILEGVIGDRAVLVLHDGSPRSTRAVEDGVLPRFADASIDVDSAVVVDCGGADSGLDLNDRFVVTLVPAPCLADLTVEAGTAGSDVRWLVVEDDLSLARSSGAVFDASAFDTALAYEFAPMVEAGLPRDRAPVSRDRACVDFLDGFTGTDTPFPSVAFTAHARLCSTIAGLIGALHAAGEDPSPDAILASVPETSTDLVLSQGQRRGLGDDPWLAPAVITTVEWNADCGCWTYVRGPDLAAVD